MNKMLMDQILTKSISKTLASFFLAFAMSQNVAAQDKPRMTMKTYSVVSAFELPPWSAGFDILETSEIFRNEGKAEAGHNFFIWEAIPKGESFEDWTKLFGLTAENPLNGDLERFANGQVNQYQTACDNPAVQFSDTTPNTKKLFVVYCPSYKDRPETGEVAFFNMQLIDNTLVKNYFHVLVPKFDLSDANALPLSSEEMIRILTNIGSLKLITQ